jgi:hypothetical protein
VLEHRERRWQQRGVVVLPHHPREDQVPALGGGGAYLPQAVGYFMIRTKSVTEIPLQFYAFHLRVLIMK